MNKLATVLLSGLLGLSACAEPLDEELAAELDEVIEGTIEPDYKHPWVVTIGSGGCKGTVIHPSWVLTAAHCVYGPWAGYVSYERTDPYTGQVESGKANAATGGTYKHPEYVPTAATARGDIALVKLAQPLPITPYLQTVWLPHSPRAGQSGAVASFSHTDMLAPGQVAVMRSSMLEISSPYSFEIRSPVAGLCSGDSGSGFITIDGGRATIRGVAARAVTGGCDTVNQAAELVDVHFYKPWILATMNKTEAQIEGNTRVHVSGKLARGVMGIGCTNPSGTLWGPLNVTGAELDAECAAGETQSVVCWMQGTQTGIIKPTIVGFKMKTTQNGITTTQSLPFSATSASYYGLLPAGQRREFICEIGSSITKLPTGGGVIVASP